MKTSKEMIEFLKLFLSGQETVGSDDKKYVEPHAVLDLISDIDLLEKQNEIMKEAFRQISDFETFDVKSRWAKQVLQQIKELENDN